MMESAPVLIALTVGVLSVDEAWSVDYVNPAAERVLGLPRHLLTGPLYRNAVLRPFFEAVKHATDDCRWGYARTLDFERDGTRVGLRFRVVLIDPDEHAFHGAVVLIEEAGERDIERLASAGRCADELARQLRDGLMSVLGWAEVVRQRLAADARTAEEMSGLMSAIETCHDLIERSLDAAREESR